MDSPEIGSFYRNRWKAASQPFEDGVGYRRSVEMVVGRHAGRQKTSALNDAQQTRGVGLTALAHSG